LMLGWPGAWDVCNPAINYASAPNFAFYTFHMWPSSISTGKKNLICLPGTDLVPCVHSVHGPGTF
jgi:hypothetical protein